MVIVITNDDGYQAEGLTTLLAVLEASHHEVWVCAPSDQRSAQSHAMTLRGKVKITQYGERKYHCSGTPADCILYGICGKLLPVSPEVVISGINHGYNASTDILYSGTVGAASEAALRGIPSLAISCGMDYERGQFSFFEAASFVANNLEKLLSFCSKDVLLNINVPPHPNGKCAVGDIGYLSYLDVVERHSSARKISFDASSTKLGLAYGTDREDQEKESVELSLRADVHPEILHTSQETDFHMVKSGYISITPLKVQPVIDETVAIHLSKVCEESWQ